MDPGPTEVQVAVIGLAGALVGGFLTGIAQLVAMWRADVAARRAVNREERKRIYLEALWGLRRIRQEFRLGLLAENAAREKGEEYEPPLPTEWDELSRILLEASILADTKVHQDLERAADEFRNWLMGLDPSAPITGFADVDTRLDLIEQTLRDVIRRDLNVADRKSGLARAPRPSANRLASGE
jgi:hypothetical protein